MPKIMPRGLIVCCWCFEGGNKDKGPLKKVDPTNYAHDSCFSIHGKPGIENKGLRKFVTKEQIDQLNKQKVAEEQTDRIGTAKMEVKP